MDRAVVHPRSREPAQTFPFPDQPCPPCHLSALCAYEKAQTVVIVVEAWAGIKPNGPCAGRFLRAIDIFRQHNTFGRFGLRFNKQIDQQSSIFSRWQTTFL